MVQLEGFAPTRLSAQSSQPWLSSNFSIVALLDAYRIIQLIFLLARWEIH